MSHVIFMALAPMFFVMALGYAAGRMRTDLAEAGSMVIASNVFSIAALAITIGVLFFPVRYGR